MKRFLSELFADPGPDFRIGLRRLASRPGFATLVVAFLALGIGATITTFSLVETLLLRPLPYRHADRLARLYSSHPENGWDRFGVSVQDLVDWRRQSTAFDALEAYHYIEATVLGRGGDQAARRVRALLVTPGIFDTVGARPRLGRTLVAEDGTQGRDRVAVLSYGFWQNVLGGEPDVVGRPLQLAGDELTVVGVMPAGFFLPVPDIAFWRPLVLADQGRASGRGSRFLEGLGRRAVGVGMDDARQELETIAARLASEYPDTNQGWTVVAIAARDWIVGDSRSVVLLLWAAVATVLLVICANVATLLLARAGSRQSEMSTRAALGAGRARLMRQLLVESLVLAGLGGLAGLALAVGALRLLPRLPGVDLPRLAELRLGPLSIGFACGLVALVAILFGALPAWRASRAGFDTLRTRTLGTGGRLSAAMVVAQIALALVLLVAAGLLAGSLRALLGVDPGLEESSLLTLRVAPLSPSPELDQAFAAGDEQRAFALYRTAREQAAVYYREAIDRLQALGVVERAAAINYAPLDGSWWITGIDVPGRPADDQKPTAYYRAVTPGYFETAGIPLVRGRVFEDSDNDAELRVAVIDRELARAYFGDRDPIGAQIGTDAPDGSRATVIGVVGSVHQRALDEPPEPTVYVPLRQAWQGFAMDWAMTILARTRVEPSAAADAVRRELQAMRPELPIVDLAPMATTVRSATAARRLAGGVLATFGVTALLVAAFGVFASTLERVQHGTPMLGLRMALGARPIDVVLLVLRRGLALALLGLALGAPAARLVVPVLRSQLYGVAPGDAGAYLLAAGLVVLAALLAHVGPALRAVRIDPLRALRS